MIFSVVDLLKFPVTHTQLSSLILNFDILQVHRNRTAYLFLACTQSVMVNPSIKKEKPGQYLVCDEVFCALITSGKFGETLFRLSLSTLMTLQ